MDICMNSTQAELTMDLLEQYSAALRQALWEATHAENYSAGPVGPVSVRLSCCS